jgi:hypothetical protein
MRPWEPLGMTTRAWMRIPPKVVALALLIPTQEIATLFPYDTSASGDPFPHAVRWCGRLYINDGHHRIARRIRAGKGYTAIRIFDGVTA